MAERKIILIFVATNLYYYLMNLRRLSSGILFCLALSTTHAQMTFTLNGVTFGDVAERDSKGFTTVTLPAGTDLSGLITACAVDGFPVTPADIIPNPATTTINYDELKVFTYNNKAYGFRFTEDAWFCAVFFSDCHINQQSTHDGTSVADMTAIMNNILNMGKDGQKKVTFTTNPNLIPMTSIVFCALPKTLPSWETSPWGK